MGIIIEFPMSQRMAQAERRTDPEAPAQVVILPVIRIERMTDQPDGRSRATGRKRRRRAQRS